MAKLMEQGKNM